MFKDTEYDLRLKSPVGKGGWKILFASAVLLVSSCMINATDSNHGGSADSLPAISLSIHNGQPRAPIELVADQEYVFDRIKLEVENRNVKDSQDALDWLKSQSSFRILNWDGVRETRAHWRNYRASRPEADLFSHVFEGAEWMTEPNSLDLSVLNAKGEVLGSPMRLSNQDFLNQPKQWDFDMIKAEYRYENFARHKDKNSARVKRAVAQIVFAVQTNLGKRLRVPGEAASLRVIWDKKPEEPYIFPIRFVLAPYQYGAKLEVKVEPEKALYLPGEKIRATFSLLDRSGAPLKFSEFMQNGITQVNIHLDGPVQNPTFYHEEWLTDFRGRRFAHHFRAPALGLGTAEESTNTPLKGPPLDLTGTQLVVELHVPENLPKEAYGTFEIGATAWRSYASENLITRLEKPIQVAQREETHFEKFGCPSCHVSGSMMDLGLLIPPMVGTEKLRVQSIQDCVMCHDNSRNGSRRLDKYLHLIHMNRENFPAAKNNCAVCHITAASIRKVSFEVCSNCHENLHQNNRPNYADSQCRNCHTDFSRGHIGPRVEAAAAGAHGP